MAKKSYPQAQNPLILRSHRLMEAFAKSDDERDFYLDKVEGFILYVDLDKPLADVKALQEEYHAHKDRYCAIPKLTFYETKKIMEGFVHEKVYDIDTKEKLIDIIQSKQARENFLEFIYENHNELEKWQQYYQERSRIRITEWLRTHNFHFVFEEDLDLNKVILDKLKENLFESKVGKEIQAIRKTLNAKAKTYYSIEALNPRPKRGRPPKQAVKLEIDTHISSDIYTTVPKAARPFLFIPEISSASAVTFSSEFKQAEEISSWKAKAHTDVNERLKMLNQKLASLQTLTKQIEQTPLITLSKFQQKVQLATPKKMPSTENVEIPSPIPTPKKKPKLAKLKTLTRIKKKESKPATKTEKEKKPAKTATKKATKRPAQRRIIGTRTEKKKK